MISDFIKKISPQVGLEPTKMRHDLKKSVSVLPEGEEKILSFISDFRARSLFFQLAQAALLPKLYCKIRYFYSVEKPEMANIVSS